MEAAAMVTPTDGRRPFIQMIAPAGVPGKIVAANAGSYRFVGDAWELDDGFHICMEALGETMITGLARAEDGNSYAFTHSDSVIYGDHPKWDDLCLTSDSGIRGLCTACPDCNLAHTHFFGFLGHGPMPPGAGTHDALDLFPKLGWKLIESLAECASPMGYQACQFIAGRRRS
jgi:hypothetical protein